MATTWKEPLSKINVKAQIISVRSGKDNQYYKADQGTTELNWTIEVSGTGPQELDSKYWYCTREEVINALMDPEWVQVKPSVMGVVMDWIVTKNTRGFVNVKDVVLPLGPRVLTERPQEPPARQEPMADNADEPPMQSQGDEPEYTDKYPDDVSTPASPAPVQAGTPDRVIGPLTGPGLAEQVRQNIKANRAESEGVKENGPGGPNLTGRDAVFMARLWGIQNDLYVALKDFEGG